MAEGRLTGLDASFLHMENGGAHMHVAGLMLFDGDPPSHDELIEVTESRLHLVPRYRQKLAFVPLGQGRPRWVDDPHLNLRYHVRRTALPPPGSRAQLKALAGRVFSQPLDRDKPLWEMWLVEGLEAGPNGSQFAILSKTHHALVDGISGVDIVSVLFDASAERSEQTEPPPRWIPSPEPSGTQLLAEALIERATVPAEILRSMRAVARGPRQIAQAAGESIVGVGAMAWAGLRPPPQSPYSTDLGPHRRYAWTAIALDDMKAIKNELGGTVNDVVLAGVAGAIARHLSRRGAADGVRTLRAMVPVSVRSADERGQLGNKVAAMMAPLPIAERDARARLKIVTDAMAGIKRSGQAVGAQVLTELTGFAPPTLMAQGSRLISTARFFNLVVTNVPGPQFPLYLLGREMREIFPMVPLARGQALGVAIMSYNGRMGFGLLGDWDAMADLDDLAGDLNESLAELADAAGVKLRSAPRPARSKPQSRKHVAT